MDDKWHKWEKESTTKEADRKWAADYKSYSRGIQWKMERRSDEKQGKGGVMDQKRGEMKQESDEGKQRQHQRGDTMRDSVSDRWTGRVSATARKERYVFIFPFTHSWTHVTSSDMPTCTNLDPNPDSATGGGSMKISYHSRSTKKKN